MTDAHTISPYLTLPLRTEEEAAAAAAAEKAQAVFLEVATTATLIKLAKSKAHELDQLDYISAAAFHERLLSYCRVVCGGDELKAALLASAALEG